MARWILETDLAVVEARALAACASIPETRDRQRAYAYSEAYGSELERLSHEGPLEEVEAALLYAIHRHGVNAARFKNHGWNVDAFDRIRVDEVGRKRNIVYVVDGRLL